MYYNNKTFDVFEEFLAELDANLEEYALTVNGWEKFYVRPRHEISEEYEYEFCWEFISINSDVLDLAKNLVQ